jgi:hypothetical protein
LLWEACWSRAEQTSGVRTQGISFLALHYYWVNKPATHTTHTGRSHVCVVCRVMSVSLGMCLPPLKLFDTDLDNSGADTTHEDRWVSWKDSVWLGLINGIIYGIWCDSLDTCFLLHTYIIIINNNKCYLYWILNH